MNLMGLGQEGLGISALQMLNCWQRPVADLRHNEEKHKGFNFHESFALHHTSSLADVCCHFATYDIKFPNICLMALNLRNGLRGTVSNSKSLLGEKIAPLSECFCSGFVLLYFLH